MSRSPSTAQLSSRRGTTARSMSTSAEKLSARSSARPRASRSPALEMPTDDPRLTGLTMTGYGNADSIRLTAAAVSAATSRPEKSRASNTGSPA